MRRLSNDLSDVKYLEILSNDLSDVRDLKRNRLEELKNFCMDFSDEIKRDVGSYHIRFTAMVS